MEKDEFSKLISAPDLERLEIMLSNESIFDILKVTNTEIRHSNFLAWLLNPKASHQLQEKFLRRFLKEVFADGRVLWMDEFRLDGLELNGVVIHRELRHMDLVVETEDFAVVIENKVWSGEGHNQLKRYRETAEAVFKGKNLAFVFLTPFGNEATDSEDALTYVEFDYGSVVRILENILDIHAKAISEKSRIYIEEYIQTVRRHIMKDDDAVNIAQEIYKNHKEALDFIFENKPDRMSDVAPVFVQAFKECGYVPGTQNKGYARFWTKEMSEKLPATGEGWKEKEPFLFEIDYWKNRLSFKCVIPPGDKVPREELKECLKDIKGYKASKSLKWSSVISRQHKIDVYADTSDDMDQLLESLKRMLAAEKELIDQVSTRVVGVFDT